MLAWPLLGIAVLQCDTVLGGETEGMAVASNEFGAYDVWVQHLYVEHSMSIQMLPIVRYQEPIYFSRKFPEIIFHLFHKLHKI